MPSSRRTNAHPPLAGLWVVSYGEDDDRELTLAQVRRAYERGEIDERTLVWRDGMPDFAPLAEVSELAAIAAPASRATPIERSPASDPADDELEAGRPSGAPRLSALTAASARSHTQPPKRADRLDADILKLGAAGPLIGPPTIDVSNLSSPTPDPEPRTREPARDDEARSRSPWPWVALALGAAVVVSWLIVRPPSSSDEPAVPAATVEADPESVAATSAPTASEPAPEPSASAIDLDPTAAPAPPPAPTRAAPAPEEPVAKAPAANEPEPEPEAPSLAAFDAAAANASLALAAGRASTCRKAGDPSGVTHVTVTFAPSGRVTTAVVSGPPFAGTATGGCIATTLRGASVPAFSGERVTVTKTVVIH